MGAELETIVCVGTVVLRNNKKGIKYFYLDKNGNVKENDSLVVAATRKTRSIIGLMYEVERTEEGVISNWEPLEKVWANSEDNRRWRLASDVAATEIKMHADTIKRAKEQQQALVDALKPARVMYMNARSTESRAAVIATVIKEITKLR